jgi:putative transposase
MKKSQITEAQIVGMIKQYEQGVKVSDIARANNISEKTFYRLRSQYAGMGINELKRVKELESENAKLKRMYAELAMDNHALRDLIEKKL